MHCSRYNECLDQAVEHQWPSWTCERCPLKASAAHEQTPSERLHDMHALCALATRAGFDGEPANDNRKDPE